jgi:hypothetical protein
MLIFQGSFWKGWQSMLSLVEVLALVTIGGLLRMSCASVFAVVERSRWS